MKRFMFLIVAMLMFTGCGAGSTNTDNSAATEDSLSPEEKFTDGDFTIYGENGVPFVNLAMTKEDAEKRLKSFKDEVGTFDIKYGEHIVPDPKEDATKEELVNYIGYIGPRVPVYTSKGVSTTGIYGENEGCSTDADVIEAYGIDTETESYITNKTDDKNYYINLYYNDDERVITPKDTELSSVEAQKLIRFTIKDGVVKNIEFYQYLWELL